MLTILLHHARVRQDEHIAENIAAHLRTPETAVTLYRDITAGSNIPEAKAAINKSAGAVLVLISADFLSNAEHVQDMTTMIKQRPDLFASQRIFALFVRATLWNGVTGDGKIHALLGGRVSRNEETLVAALQEMLGRLSGEHEALALPEPE